MALTGVFATLPNLEFAVKDASLIEQAVIKGFQGAWLAATGQPVTLAPGDPRTLFLLNIADLISAQRSAIDYAAKLDLLAYSSGAALDHIGAYYGEDGLRLTQHSASTFLQFTLGTVAGVDVTLLKGTQAAVGALIFATDADVIIPAGTVTSPAVSAACLTPGTIGNGFFPGQITTLLTSTDPYTITVTNTISTSGGSDPEQDPAYSQRLYIVPAALSKSGPRLSYQADAFKADSAITDVVVCGPSDIGFDGKTNFPLGTVNIFAIGPSGAPLSATVQAEIYNICSAEDRRPVADFVNVYNPSGVPVNLSVQFWVDQADTANETVIVSNVQAAGNQYVIDLTSKIGRSINSSQLSHLMVQQGASRVKVVSPPDQVLQRWQIARMASAPQFVYEGLETDYWKL